MTPEQLKEGNDLKREIENLQMKTESLQGEGSSRLVKINFGTRANNYEVAIESHEYPELLTVIVSLVSATLSKKQEKLEKEMAQL